MSSTTTFSSYQQACEQHRWDVPERYNIAVDVCDRHPRDKLAMIHEDFRGRIQEISWGELQDDSNRFANVLRAHGVDTGDRVAMLLPATPQTAAAFFGVWKAGAILLSMSDLYGDEGIRHRVGDSRPKVLLTNAENAGRIDRSMVEHLLILDDELLGRGSTAFDPVDTAADDAAQLYYSSGTTGLAKGILHAHRYILAHEEFTYCHDLRDGELFHGMGEWAWAAGICPLLGPWRLGAVQAVYQREGGFDPARQLDFLSRHGVSNVFGTPTAIRSMMSISDAGTRYPQKFRIVCSAGEPLNPEAIRWFREQYGLTVLDYYGLTESYPLCANYPFMEVREGSMGRPMPGWEVATLDEDERPVAAGERGEICLKARSNPHYPLGYGTGRRRRSPHLTSGAATWSRRSSCWRLGTILPTSLPRTSRRSCATGTPLTPTLA
jgi:acetyl-CoA synthetase